LRQTRAVAQVDELDTAVVAQRVNPPNQGHVGGHIAFAEGVTGMCAFHAPCLVRMKRTNMSKLPIGARNYPEPSKIGTIQEMQLSTTAIPVFFST
jgi:hypothetical protein